MGSPRQRTYIHNMYITLHSVCVCMCMCSYVCMYTCLILLLSCLIHWLLSHVHVHNTQDEHSVGATLLLQSMEEIAVSFAYNIPSNNATTSYGSSTVESVFNGTWMSERFGNCEHGIICSPLIARNSWTYEIYYTVNQIKVSILTIAFLILSKYYTSDSNQRSIKTSCIPKHHITSMSYRVERKCGSRNSH